MTRRPWEWQVDRMEQVAEALHNAWWAYQIEQRSGGIGPPKQLGPRDREKGWHPHLVPWACKDDAGRNQDRFQAAVLLTRKDPFAATTEREIHDAWVCWVKVHGGGVGDPHATPYDDAHKSIGPCEHTKQAEAVNRLFHAWQSERVNTEL